MKLAILGATGLVGSEVIKVLEERDLPIEEFIPIASARSRGKEVEFAGKSHKVLSPEEALGRHPTVAIFSAGGSASLQYAPMFSEAGTYVIDNSSAWRMDDGVPLVVPEVNHEQLNPESLKLGRRIIANPNCSTIQMVVPLHALHRRYGLKRVVVSTYQSVTGSGVKAVTQLFNERKGVEGEMAYPYQIDMNLIPHIDAFLDNGYTKEEMKLVHETRKVLGLPDLRVTATTVRVPVVGGHSESINVEFENDFDLHEVRDLLGNLPGVVLLDAPFEGKYPMPLHVHGKDGIYVGRLRRDEGNPNTLNMWVVADNLRKGAATNAVQILELLVQKGIVS